MSNESRPNFYAIIPAHVRYCKELELGARLLYGEITALANQEGYCWATNQYFADLYEIDTRTIQRWIESLKKLKFIATEISIEGFQRTRKIWISHEIKKVFATRQNCRDVVTKMPPRGDKNAAYINTYNNTSNKEDPLPPKGELVSYGKFVKLSKKEFDELCDLVGSSAALLEIITEMNDYLASTGKKPYKDYAAALRNWIRRRSNNNLNAKNSSLGDPGLIKTLKGRKDISERKDVVFGPSYVELGHGTSVIHIKYSDHGFNEQVLSRLRKMGIDVSDLG